MGDILIRPVRIEDAQGMIDVINPIIRAGGTTAIESEYTLDAQRDYINDLGPRHTCLLALDGEVVVGFQSIALHPALPPDVADIATFVRIGEQGRGVGARLTAATVAAIPALGYGAINATIRADNFEGLAFYTRMGFRDWSVARAKPLRTGGKVDRISKRRIL